MGGHGALVVALKNSGAYRSVSAFSPICNPSETPWGQKAMGAYLGDGNRTTAWDEWDASKLVEKYDGPAMRCLVDQGLDDEFLAAGQLQPHVFFAAAASNSKFGSCELRQQKGYDHSYYFIASFIGDHIEMHAKELAFEG